MIPAIGKYLSNKNQIAPGITIDKRMSVLLLLADNFFFFVFSAICVSPFIFPSLDTNIVSSYPFEVTARDCCLLHNIVNPDAKIDSFHGNMHKRIQVIPQKA